MADFDRAPSDDVAEEVAAAHLLLIERMPKLRDRFAMAALQAIRDMPRNGDWPEPARVAQLAYELADAMIAARDKKGTP